MQRATISELKNKLSAYLRRVRAGESILILDRDEPVARLVPIMAEGDSGDRLVRLERSGLIRRSTKPLPPVDTDAVAGAASAQVLDALLEERRSGR